MTKTTGRRGVPGTLTAVHERPMEAEDREPTTTVKSTKLLLTPQEAAAALSINRSTLYRTLYRMIMRDEIPSIMIGRARRFPLKWLEAWIEQQIAA